MSVSKTPNTQTSGPHHCELRGAIRFSLPAQINVQYVRTCRKMHEDDASQRFWVTTKDVSRGGIGFFHSKMMYFGELLCLELRLEGGDFRYITASVVRCRRADDGRFEIGAAFETVESATESSVAAAPTDAIEP